MKVLTTQPIQFTAGDDLSPEDLNALYNYGRDSLTDVASKRWAKGAVTFQYVTDVSNAYTNITSTESLTCRFTCPQTCVVERAFLSANLTSANEVSVSFIDTTTGLAPTGATTPLLSTDAAVASSLVDVTDINVDRFVLVAGREYTIVVAGAGVFSLERFDVTIHVAVDRWTLAGTTDVPLFLPTLVTDASFRDATVVVANNAALATQSAKLAAGLTAVTPLYLCTKGFVLGTAAALRTHQLPRQDSATTQRVLKRIYLYAEVTGGGGAVTVSATLLDQAGATLLTVSGFTGSQISVDSGALSTSFVTALAGAAADSTKDYSLVFAITGAKTCTKAQALLWFARA